MILAKLTRFSQPPVSVAIKSSPIKERIDVNRTDNANFAIKGSTVKQFLTAHNVPTKWSNRQIEMDTKDIYKLASKQTVMVVCHPL